MIDVFNNWLAFGIFACILIGFYDVLKKIILNTHGIVIVLFCSSVFSGLVLLPFLVFSSLSIIPQNTFWNIPPLEPLYYFLIFIKSLSITTVWFLAFKSMQNLPISIVTPIYATDTIWTFLGAILIFNEKINFYQWLALFIFIFSFIYFAKTGKKEGIYFHRNRYIVYLMMAIILSTFSSLYDKYLMGFLHPFTVLVWFSLYNVLIFFIYTIITNKFSFKVTYENIVNLNIKTLGVIALIGILVSSQDLSFFYALSLEDSMVSVLTTIKRSSAVVSFLVGAVIFRENLLRQKFYSLLGIIVGIFLLLLSSSN